jgi:hypothetical protein
VRSLNYACSYLRRIVLENVFVIEDDTREWDDVRGLRRIRYGYDADAHRVL